MHNKVNTILSLFDGFINPFPSRQALIVTMRVTLALASRKTAVRQAAAASRSLARTKTSDGEEEVIFTLWEMDLSRRRRQQKPLLLTSSARSDSAAAAVKTTCVPLQCNKAKAEDEQRTGKGWRERASCSWCGSY